jgi:hypothetical protein
MHHIGSLWDALNEAAISCHCSISCRHFLPIISHQLLFHPAEVQFENGTELSLLEMKVQCLSSCNQYLKELFNSPLRFSVL